VGTSTTSGEDSVPSSSGSRYSKFRVAYAGTPEVPDAAAGPNSSGSGSDKQQEGTSGVPDPISAPGSPRGLPAIAVTAVEPGPAVPAADASSSSAAEQQQQSGRGEMQGAVREEMSLLAALAAAVQEHTRGGRQ
jgi:hypothetical protein